MQDEGVREILWASLPKWSNFIPLRVEGHVGGHCLFVSAPFWPVPASACDQKYKHLRVGATVFSLSW